MSSLENRLAIELEFVQCLANPAYLNCNKIRKSPSFLSSNSPSLSLSCSFSGTGLPKGPQIPRLPLPPPLLPHGLSFASRPPALP